MSRRVLVLHGPNLNLEAVLGVGLETFDARLLEHGRSLGLSVETFQANAEGALVDQLHAQRAGLFALVINPSSLAPIAYALADAIEALGLPCIEVQLHHESKSRGRSALRKVVEKQFHGHGAEGYLKALTALSTHSAEAISAAATEPQRIGKTIGKKKPAAARAEKTIGKGRPGSPSAPASGLITRAQVKEQVLARLGKRVAPDAFAQWARTQWLALQKGAAVEAGQKEALEELLLMLSTSAKATDHVMLSYAAKLGP